MNRILQALRAARSKARRRMNEKRGTNDPLSARLREGRFEGLTVAIETVESMKEPQPMDTNDNQPGGGLPSFRAKVAEANQRLIGHTLLLDCLANRVFENLDVPESLQAQKSKIMDALRGAHSGANDLRELLREALAAVPEDRPQRPVEDLGIVLGLVLEHSDEVPEPLLNTARKMADRHGYNREVFEQ